jgi:hypothetical protein
MNCRRMSAVWLLMGLALWGCSAIQPPPKGVWRAQPEYREVDGQRFSVSISPQKGAAPFYAFFVLTIANRSEADLIVDWNASRYLFNGRPEGMMVFEGIDPQMVKAATVPPETIAPGAVFSREIMPLRRIAWSPLKENTTSRRSITPGMLPAGQNGIRLSIRNDDGQRAIALSVRIAREDAPQP